MSTRMCRLRPQIFFPAVCAAFAASYGTGFDRLAIDDGRTRFWVSAHLGSHQLAQAAHRRLPGAVAFPEAEIMVDGFPVGQIMGHLSPGAARSQQVQDPIDDLASRDGLAGRFW